MKNINQQNYENSNENINEIRKSNYVKVKTDMGFENKDLIRKDYYQIKESSNLNLRITIDQYDDNGEYVNKEFYHIDNYIESIPIGKSSGELKPSKLDCQNYVPIQIPNKYVSKYHCEIIKRGKDYFMRGNTSSNFTFRLIKNNENLILRKNTVFQIRIKNVIFNCEIEDLSNENTDINTNISFRNIIILINETKKETLCSKEGIYSLNLSKDDQLCFEKNNHEALYYIYFDKNMKQFIFTLHKNCTEKNSWVRLVEDTSKDPIYEINICHEDVFRIANNFILKIEKI